MAGGNTNCRRTTVTQMLEPLKTESLKDVFVSRFENLILSGRLKIGERLPSERELALRLGVSRPVVHEGLVELAARGLVTIRPRTGAVINDFRQEGSLTLLNSLVNYHQGGLEPGLLESMLEMRGLFEGETVRLAARRRTGEHLAELRRILDEESREGLDPGALAEMDFLLHLQIALASGNLLYPMLLNSFKQVYTNLSGQFFADPAAQAAVLSFHRRLLEALDARDEKAAEAIMNEMLEHGRRLLTSMIELKGAGK
ncbi:MAG: FadR/GntR family transcriptional regulator [Pseudomonadota bacterium]